jgi:hypothetical protein
MSEALRSLDGIRKFIHGGHYAVTVDWGYIESWLEGVACHNLQYA